MARNKTTTAATITTVTTPAVTDSESATPANDAEVTSTTPAIQAQAQQQQNQGVARRVVRYESTTTPDDDDDDQDDDDERGDDSDGEPDVQAKTKNDRDSEIVEEIDYSELERLRTAAQQGEQTQARLKQIQKDLKAAQAKVAEFEREKMTEQQRIQADAQAAQERAADLEEKLRTERAEKAILLAAGDPAVNVRPALALQLLTGKVEFDDDGQPTGVKEALLAQIKQFPELVQRQVPAAPPANPDANKRGERKLTYDDIRGMTQEQINARWDDPEFQRVLAGQAA